MRTLFLLFILLSIYLSGYGSTLNNSSETSEFSKTELTADTSIADSLDDYYENQEIEYEDDQPEDELTYSTEPFLEDEVCSTHMLCDVNDIDYCDYTAQSHYLQTPYKGFLTHHYPPPKF